MRNHPRGDIKFEHDYDPWTAAKRLGGLMILINMSKYSTQDYIDFMQSFAEIENLTFCTTNPFNPLQTQRYLEDSKEIFYKYCGILCKQFFGTEKTLEVYCNALPIGKQRDDILGLRSAVANYTKLCVCKNQRLTVFNYLPIANRGLDCNTPISTSRNNNYAKDQCQIYLNKIKEDNDKKRKERNDDFDTNMQKVRLDSEESLRNIMNENRYESATFTKDCPENRLKINIDSWENLWFLASVKTNPPIPDDLELTMVISAFFGTDSKNFRLIIGPVLHGGYGFSAPVASKIDNYFRTLF